MEHPPTVHELAKGRVQTSNTEITSQLCRKKLQFFVIEHYICFFFCLQLKWSYSQDYYKLTEKQLPKQFKGI